MSQSQILIIEDDPAVAPGLQAGLIRQGFAVAWKSIGAEGIAYGGRVEVQSAGDGKGGRFSVRFRAYTENQIE